MELVIAGLTRLGYRVGVAKHIRVEGFTLDTQGKDTWRHARAGARVVIGVSPGELAVIKKTPSETEFHQVIRQFDGLELDVVLLEGFSSASRNWHRIPKVVVGKNKSDLAKTLARTTPPILAISGFVVSDLSERRRSRIPSVDVMKDGPIITSMIRRLIEPNEMHETLQKVAIRHGDACAGLAIGVRAAHLASSAFGLNESSVKRIDCGAKQCIVDGIQWIYPKATMTTRNVTNDVIVFRSPGAQLSLKLVPKSEAKFAKATQVLKVPENRIFQQVRLFQSGNP
jgi:molybdopterin-guanine dinucleotide biosynthesis protein MobB